MSSPGMKISKPLLSWVQESFEIYLERDSHNSNYDLQFLRGVKVNFNLISVDHRKIMRNEISQTNVVQCSVVYYTNVNILYNMKRNQKLKNCGLRGSDSLSTTL